MPHNRFITRDTLSSQVPEQLPEFVRADHPTFVAFLEAYYEWMETQDQALNISFGLRDIADVDDTLQEFIRQFKATFMLNFPEQLAIDNETGEPLDQRRIIKNIKAFYKAKGSEKSYKFLFRILFDTNVEFFFPKVDILRVSDGKFIIERFMRVTSSNGPDTFKAVGKKIQQRDRETGDITASARVTRAIQFQSGLYEVTEFVLTEIFGTFNPPQRVEFEIVEDDGTITKIEENIFTMIVSFDITNGGTGFRVGEVVRLTNASGDVGIGALGVIDRVDGKTGAILRIAVRDPGTNYLIPPIPDFSESENGTGATADVLLGPIFTADGFFGNNDGKISSNKVIQDSFFYQDYSYVLKTEVTIDKWLGTVKRVIHPAGLKVFGEVTIFRCIESEAPHETRFQAYEIPLIGHYTPYTWLTTDDLRNTAEAFLPNLDLYPDGFDPAVGVVAEDGTGGPHVPGSNPAFPGDFNGLDPALPDLLARPTLAYGSGSGPFWFTVTSVSNQFTIGSSVVGNTSAANAIVYAVDTTGTKIGLVVTDGVFILGETLTQLAPSETLTLISLLNQPVPRWGFPHRPKSDPIFIIYHHPNRRGMREIPGLGEPHPNPNMRVIDRTMLSGTFTIGESVVGDSLQITDITPYLTSLEITDASNYVLDEDFEVGEIVTGQTSGETATVGVWTPAAVGNPGSVLTVINETGPFAAGETITGQTSGVSITEGGQVTIDADFDLGETVTGQLSGATGVVLEWTPAGFLEAGSELILGEIIGGPFDDGEDIVGNISGSEITVDVIVEVGTTGTIDADDLPLTNPISESQVIMFTSGEFRPGEVMIGQSSGADARVDSLSSLIYSDGMPWRDIVVRDFARNMPVAEGILCVPTDTQEVLSDAGYPNEDIGGLDGTGPTD